MSPILLAPWWFLQLSFATHLKCTKIVLMCWTTLFCLALFFSSHVKNTTCHILEDLEWLNDQGGTGTSRTCFHHYCHLAWLKNMFSQKIELQKIYKKIFETNMHLSMNMICNKLKWIAMNTQKFNEAWTTKSKHMEVKPSDDQMKSNARNLHLIVKMISIKLKPIIRNELVYIGRME